MVGVVGVSVDGSVDGFVVFPVVGSTVPVVGSVVAVVGSVVAAVGSVVAVVGFVVACGLEGFKVDPTVLPVLLSLVFEVQPANKPTAIRTISSARIILCDLKNLSILLSSFNVILYRALWRKVNNTRLKYSLSVDIIKQHKEVG